MLDNVELDSPKGDVIQTNEENPNGQSTQTNADTSNEDAAKIEAEKLLQAEYTRTRQALIESTKKLVEKDGSELHNIQDPKLRDSVSKALFNMGYAEAEAVFGKGFTTTDKSEDDSEATTETIQKELRLLKYRESQREVDIAINELRNNSPEMFNGVSDMDEKIREELSNIVSTLPIKERVRRAATNVFGSVWDSTSLAYKILNQKNSGVVMGGSRQGNGDDSKTKKDETVSSLSSFMLKSMGITKNK